MKKLYEIFIVLTMRIIYFIFPKAHDSYGLAFIFNYFIILVAFSTIYILYIQHLIHSYIKNYEKHVFAAFLILIIISYGFLTFNFKRNTIEEYSKNSNYKIALIYKLLYIVFILLSLYSLNKLFDLPAPLLKK